MHPDGFSDLLAVLGLLADDLNAPIKSAVFGIHVSGLFFSGVVIAVFMAAALFFFSLTTLALDMQVLISLDVLRMPGGEVQCFLGTRDELLSEVLVLDGCWLALFGVALASYAVADDIAALLCKVSEGFPVQHFRLGASCGLIVVGLVQGPSVIILAVGVLNCERGH